MHALPMNRPGLARSVQWLVLAVLGGALGVLAVAWVLPPVRLTVPADAPLNGAALTPPRPIPDLTLQRSDGATFHTADLRGQLSLVFFGYTFCPDVCPLTLSELKQVRGLLGSDADQLHVYFVTVDPARDTAERLHRYVKAFDPAFEGLTGEPAALASMRAAFGAIGERRDAPDGGPNYFMDHTAALFLVDTSGGISLVYAYGTPPGQLADDVRQLARQAHAAPTGPTGRHSP